MLQVAFFLPQLVQLLRGDSNGMIQQFLFTAAGRSNVFAYNLVCILKVHMDTSARDVNALSYSAAMLLPECFHSLTKFNTVSQDPR